MDLRRASIGLLTAFCCSSFAPSAFAAAPVSRIDAFAIIWRSVMRASENVSEKQFADVPADHPLSHDIRYAKSRGILDNDDTFRPNDPLTLRAALIWLYRTRNVTDVKDITVQKLPDLLARYPIANVQDDAALLQTLSEDQLLSLMRSLDKALADEVHEASLYGEEFQGAGTAFGEKFNMYALTAAHRTLPYNTLVRVTNVDNGKSVVVRINDRGPYVKGRDMDLSVASFEMIADRGEGKINARFERLGDATMVPACLGTSPRARHITRTVLLNAGVPRQLKIGDTLTLTSTKTFVVRSVTYPDGTLSRFEQWISPDESFELKPGTAGDYQFHLSASTGQNRTFHMEAVDCPN